MLLKLKSQFEELRSRVVFLECVKKYLEVETKLLVCVPLNYSSSCECEFSCVLEDSERGPMGFGGFSAALSGCLWIWFFGSSVL